MRPKRTSRLPKLIGIFLIGSAALLVQPSMAQLCGNCSTGWHDVLSCYASSNSNNSCFTVRCTADGDEIGGVQRAYCCFDEDPCAF